MSTWQDFLRFLDELRGGEAGPVPGAVMFSFVNRYLEPMDNIKYRIEFDGKTVSGITSKEQHSVEILPVSFKPIKVYAWSRVRKDFKLIDEVSPVAGKRLLINERMKTFKHDSKTQPHPRPQPASPLPQTQPAKAQPASKGTANRHQQPQGVEPVKAKNANEEPEHRTNRPVGDKIEVVQLKKIFPAADESYLGKVADELNRDLEKYKLDTPLRRAHFFAQVRQEAGAGLSPKQESLNYRPDVLIDKFSYYQAHPAEAKADGRLEEMVEAEKVVKGVKKKVKVKKIVHKADQATIANKAYGGRGGNGAAVTGDGWRFRGRGIFQLTLRDNYTNFNSEYTRYWNDGAVDFLKSPDAVCEYPYFIRSAVWFWLKHSIYTKADRGATAAAVNAVTRVINPGMDGAAERRNNFDELTYPAFK